MDSHPSSKRVPIRVFGWRAAGVERSRPSFWGRLQPFSSLVENFGLEWLRPSIEGMRYGMDGSFHTVSGSHVS
jgi:hypothetical protein